MRNALVRLLGWKAMILQGDPMVVDRWRWLKRHLRPGSLRTLDAGCGGGAFTIYAAKLGNHCLGISFDERQLDSARDRAEILGIANVEFRQGDLRRLDQFAGSLGDFDQILLFETIEHIRDDAKLLADVVSLLRPGGTLLLTAPYQHHHPLFGEHVSDVEDGGHVRFGYTHDELRSMLERLGLEVVTEEFVSGVVSQKLADVQYALIRVHPLVAWAVTFPLRVTHGLDALLTRGLNYPHLSVAVVGRKPAPSVPG